MVTLDRKEHDSDDSLDELKRTSNGTASVEQHYVSPGRHGLTDDKMAALDADSAAALLLGDEHEPPQTTMSAESRNLFFSYWRAIGQMNREDLVDFCRRHDEMFAEAKRTNDYARVTTHYYSVMSGVIETYYGGSFHFVPPDHVGQTMRQATHSLHRRIARLLQHGVGKHCLDIGCGVGEAMVDVSRECGGRMTGITIAPNEARRGNETFAERGVGALCRSVVGDAHVIPFAAATFDCAYAVYALKYFPDVTPVFNEVHRVLKPGGLFLVYDIVRTDVYDDDNKQHRQLVEGFEYACGMPSLHTNAEMSRIAHQVGLEPVCQMDITADRRLPWYHFFVENAWFTWMIDSPWMDTLLGWAETGGLVNQGFARFAQVFLSGTVNKIVKAGQQGILSGSNVIIFRKKTDNSEGAHIKTQ